MLHARIETIVRTNPKFLQAGPAPSWLWLCSVLYCQEALTDGFIAEAVIDYLGVKAAHRLVPHLVRAHLWEPVDGGYRVHDYLEHNPSAADIEELRRVRQAAGQAGGQASAAASARARAVANGQASGPANAQASAQRLAQAIVNPSPTPVPTPVPVPVPTPSPTPVPVPEGEARARPRAGAPLVDQREHRHHAHCGRVCLHASLFGEFVRRRNHADADQEIRAWAMEVERQWEASPDEPGDAFEFWRMRYQERWPAKTGAKSTFGTWRPKAEVPS